MSIIDWGADVLFDLIGTLYYYCLFRPLCESFFVFSSIYLLYLILEIFDYVYLFTDIYFNV